VALTPRHSSVAMKKQRNRMTEAQCNAEIKYYNEQLKLLDETGSNDILLEHLDEMQAAHEEYKRFLERRLQQRLENTRKFTDFQLQAINDQVRCHTRSQQE